MSVEIKGHREGFSIIIDGRVDFSEAKEMILQKFDESKDFFKGANFLDFNAPGLEASDITHLKNILTDHYRVNFISKEEESENRKKNIHSDFQGEARDYQDDYKARFSSLDETINRIKQITSNESKMDKKVKIEDNNLKTKFVFENMRSGAEIEYDGNLVIFGDVNPGARVTAKGNILIMGSFRGMAYAGKDNTEDCFVAALKLLPLQIRIKDLFAVPPEDAKIIEQAMVKIQSGEIVIEHF